MIPVEEIAGIILAGGKASRMRFQDKALLHLHDQPLIEHVIANAHRQVGRLAISANHNLHKYRYLGLPVIRDAGNQYAGPLVGICSALRWFHNDQDKTGIKYLACFAADVPCFPNNLVAQLAEQLHQSDCEVTWCRCDGQLQPLFSLWRLNTLPALESAIASGLYGPKLVIPKFRNVVVDIEKLQAGYFLNINSEQLLATAQKLIKREHQS